MANISVFHFKQRGLITAAGSTAPNRGLPTVAIATTRGLTCGTDRDNQEFLNTLVFDIFIICN